MVTTPASKPLPAPAAQVSDPQPVGAFPLRLQLPSDWELTDEALLELSSLNEGWRIETDAGGGLLIMSPTGPRSSIQGGHIFAQLYRWSFTQGIGEVVDASAAFLLPNGERRMPDAAWISNARLADVDEDGPAIWRVCPDFIVEVRSASDRLDLLQQKMEMWLSQGARLGWLVDPLEQTVWVYVPEQDAQRFERPDSLTAAEIAADLTIDLSRVWPPRAQARRGEPSS